MAGFVFEKVEEGPAVEVATLDAASALTPDAEEDTQAPAMNQNAPRAHTPTPTPRGNTGGQNSGQNDTAATPMTTHGTANVHDDVSIRSGVQVDANTGATTHLTENEDAAVQDITMRVSVKATQAKPVKATPGEQPDRKALFNVHKSKKHGTKVKHVQGDVAGPNINRDMVPDSLFINGAPLAADIRQGGIGDCYYQAVLLGIVNGDPGKIGSMMSFSGGSVTTTFYRLNTATGQWVPARITNDAKLQHVTNATGGVTYSLQGAQFRVADAPQESMWWSQIAGDTLKVYRKDLFQVALWSALMEKSYADFAQQFGKYGKGLGTDAGTGGYDIIDSGGGSQEVYPMFYGGAVSSQTTQDINATPGGNIAVENVAAIQQLLALEAHKSNPGVAGGQQNFVQARISPEGAINRCKAMSQAIIDHHYNEVNGGTGGAIRRFFGGKDKRAADQKKLDKALTSLIKAIDKWKGQKNAVNLTAVARAADAIQKPGAFPLLSAEGGATPLYNQLNENLGIVINLGTDNSPGRRMVYASHAYNVNSVTLKNAEGQALALAATDLPARATEIDATKSNIVVENPHAGNEPDLDGNGPKDGKNDGRFDMSLDSFLRNFDMLRLATVDHKPQLGDFPTPSGDVGFA